MQKNNIVENSSSTQLEIWIKELISKKGDIILCEGREVGMGDIK